MVNINFMPDDYVQNKESQRANIVYFVLFAIMMAALGGTFTVIKIRQRTVNMSARVVDEKYAKAQDDITHYEQLEAKYKLMVATSSMTSQLIEPVPRSVLFADLVNSMPSGLALSSFKLDEKEVKTAAPARTKYQKTQQNAKKAAAPAQQASYETKLEICGYAGSDIQVASYIANLSNSVLLDQVALVQSKETKVDDDTVREFKLTAQIRDKLCVSDEHIETIKNKKYVSSVK